MPFFVIQGTFRLLDRTKTGNLTGFEPDGDSMQFKAKNPAVLDRLTRVSLPVRLTAIGSVQLRFEGIDALELHFRPPEGGSNVHQPRPLADDSRDFLTKELGLDPVQYSPPKDLRVQPPSPHDGAPGFILARSLEVHGRPVSFVFAGTAPARDGAQIRLNASLLKRSLNYKSVLRGFAYPLFYDTLFKDLREALTDATREARKNRRGLWARDGSQRGVRATGPEELEVTGVTFPKLFRRLVEYFAGSTGGVGKFLSFPKLHKEQVQDMDPDSPQFTNFTHFDNMIRVKDKKVSLRQMPETLVFVSEKATRK
jgi:endonuclease YncB( thermonuclease family)